MKDKLKYIIAIILVFIILILAVSYYMRFDNVSLEISQANFQSLHQTIKPGTFKNSYKHFDGSESVVFNIHKGNKIKFNYNSTINDGVLSITINDSNGAVLANLPVNKKGTLNIVANATGEIRITVVGKNTSGSFKIKWRGPLF